MDVYSMCVGEKNKTPGRPGLVDYPLLPTKKHYYTRLQYVQV